MSDTTALKALVRKARTANVGVLKATRKAQVLSAEATHAVVVAGEIGNGKLYGSQKDYALALGVSEGQITRLKTIGKAMSLGFTESAVGEDVWSLFSSKAGAKEVSGAVNGEDATVDSIREALTSTFAPDGRRVAGGEGQPADGSTGDAPTDKRGKVVADALDRIRKVLPEMTAAERRVALNGITNLLAEIQEAAKAS